MPATKSTKPAMPASTTLPAKKKGNPKRKPWLSLPRPLLRQQT